MGLPPPGNNFWIVPILSFLPWYAMLITFLIQWIHQGKPNYYFMHTNQATVYISDIGAMSLHPLFIVCSAFQGLGYCVSVACEYYQRSGHWPFMRSRNNPSNKKYNTSNHHSSIPNTELNTTDPIQQVGGSDDASSVKDLENPFDEDDYDELLDHDDRSFETIRNNYSDSLLSSKFLMPPFYTKDERNLIFAAFVLGLLGEVALLLCSIFSTATHHNAHISMVVVFIVLMYFSCSCLIAEYFLMGRHYAVLHPLANLDRQVDMRKLPLYKWKGYIWNKFTISATLKSIWLFFGIIWALLFAGIEDDSLSACFEWLLAFWLGLFFVLMSVDFYLGGRYRSSRYFHQIKSFAGYYKYDNAVERANNVANTVTDDQIDQDPFADGQVDTELLNLSNIPK